MSANRLGIVRSILPQYYEHCFLDAYTSVVDLPECDRFSDALVGSVFYHLSDALC